MRNRQWRNSEESKIMLLPPNQASVSKKRSLAEVSRNSEPQIEEVKVSEDSYSSPDVVRRSKRRILNEDSQVTDRDILTQELKKRSKMRYTAESNRKFLLLMSEERQKNTCTICMEEIDIKAETRLESCNHKFCYECIYTWATKSENACPNCKKKFNIIFFKTNCGDEAELKIEDIIIPSDGLESEPCVICAEPLGSDLQAVDIC